MNPASIPASSAARLFLDAQGLLADPARKATKPELKKALDTLGFVQLDTINVLARAHDLILRTRLEGYEPTQLQALLEKDKLLFEGFTHDASLIPLRWYAHWKPRFRRDEARMKAHAWWQYHFRGTDGEAVVKGVRARIREEGPLMSKDFEHPEKRGPWWGWKPQKAALDFLWRSGELAIPRRVNFHKVYDLAERVHPEAHAAPEPDRAAHIAWACLEAAPRLVVFTPRELAGFFASIEIAEAKAWCEREAKAGRLAPVMVEDASGGKPQAAFAVADWEARLKRVPEAPAGLRLLAPFDPVVRDRARCLRRFGFDYRFEAFVPEPKREYGYFVLPILEGERFIGRLDAKTHRDQGLLEVRGLWWEKGVKATKARVAALDEALAKLAVFVGAETFSV
ncbi:MAG TPA: crosslink repair DNA glycosylase YcaQ family protein [Holophagaceae bacterium]|nr:crosslink repair DNA glycosylase YcaQ family protein [Holophagaceae bacterium]